MNPKRFKFPSNYDAHNELDSPLQQYSRDFRFMVGRGGKPWLTILTDWSFGKVKSECVSLQFHEIVVHTSNIVSWSNSTLTKLSSQGVQ